MMGSAVEDTSQLSGTNFENKFSSLFSWKRELVGADSNSESCEYHEERIVEWKHAALHLTVQITPPDVGTKIEAHSAAGNVK